MTITTTTKPRRKAIATRQDSKTVKKLPSSESGRGQVCTTRAGAVYRITQNPDKKQHTLWRVVKDGFEKIETAATPYDLYPYIDW